MTEVETITVPLASLNRLAYDYLRVCLDKAGVPESVITEEHVNQLVANVHDGFPAVESAFPYRAYTRLICQNRSLWEGGDSEA